MRKTVSLLLLLCFFACFLGIPGVAHSMIIEPLDGQKIRVFYDGGGFSRRTEVVVMDESGKELMEGRLDSEGVFSYQGIENAHKIMVDDGLGHRAEWMIGSSVTHLPKIPTVGGMLVFFGGIAWYFDKKGKTDKK